MNFDALLLLTFAPVFFFAYKSMTEKTLDLFADVSKKKEK